MVHGAISIVLAFKLLLGSALCCCTLAGLSDTLATAEMFGTRHHFCCGGHHENSSNSSRGLPDPTNSPQCPCTDADSRLAPPLSSSYSITFFPHGPAFVYVIESLRSDLGFQVSQYLPWTLHSGAFAFLDARGILRTVHILIC